jgi:hypothetical protein
LSVPWPCHAARSDRDPPRAGWSAAVAPRAGWQAEGHGAGEDGWWRAVPLTVPPARTGTTATRNRHAPALWHHNQDRNNAGGFTTGRISRQRPAFHPGAFRLRSATGTGLPWPESRPSGSEGPGRCRCEQQEILPCALHLPQRSFA